MSDNISKFNHLPSVLILFFFTINNVSADNINWNRFESDIIKTKIQWKKFIPNNSKDIIQNKSKDKNRKNKFEEINKQIEIDTKKSKITNIQPFFHTNNYLKKNDFSSRIIWLSSFKGGLSGGTGQQNNSYQFDYGLTDKTLFTFYFSEADDDLYNHIKNKSKKINYFWQNYAFSIKQKLFNYSNIDISLLNSFEIWRLSSGSEYSNSIYRDSDSFGKQKFTNFIYGFSLPISLDIYDNLSLHFIPGGSLLPSKYGNNKSEDNSYGNNLFFGTGFNYEIAKNLSLFSSYSYFLGPGNNYFNKYLEYSKKNIYSFGFNFEASPKIEIEGKITNGFGGTPATAILTLPSTDKPLYYAGIKINHNSEDINFKEFNKNDNILRFGGLTVSNSYIPQYSEKLISINMDSKNNFFAKYGYSISNIFHLELINIGSFSDIDSYSNKYKVVKDQVFSNENINYRLGGKFLIFSPKKEDDLWLSSRVSLGRNDTNNQGYVFSELISTSKLNENLYLNINPKNFWSSNGSISGLGLSLNYIFHEKISFLSEINFNLSNHWDSNSTFSIKYSPNKSNSIDLYISNSAGIQDLGQIVRDNNNRLGVKISFIY